MSEYKNNPMAFEAAVKLTAAKLSSEDSPANAVTGKHAVEFFNVVYASLQEICTLDIK